PLDREQFLVLSQRFVSAEAMFRVVAEESGLDIAEEKKDWVWVAFTCLWERWQPERPSLEMLDDQMQAGYKAVAAHDSPEACRLWLATWDSLQKIVASLQLETLDEFDV